MSDSGGGGGGGPGGGDDGGMEVSGSAVQNVADVSVLQKHLRKLVPLLLEDGGEAPAVLEAALEEKGAVEHMRKFLSDPQVHTVLVERSTLKGEARAGAGAAAALAKWRRRRRCPPGAAALLRGGRSAVPPPRGLSARGGAGLPRCGRGGGGGLSAGPLLREGGGRGARPGLPRCSCCAGAGLELTLPGGPGAAHGGAAGPAAGVLRCRLFRWERHRKCFVSAASLLLLGQLNDRPPTQQNQKSLQGGAKKAHLNQPVKSAFPW